MCCTFIYRLFQIYLLGFKHFMLPAELLTGRHFQMLHCSPSIDHMVLWRCYSLCSFYSLVQHKHNHLASSGGGMCFFPSQDQPEQAAYTQLFIQAIFWGWAASDWPIKSCLETEQHIFSSMFSWHFWIFFQPHKNKIFLHSGLLTTSPPLRYIHSLSYLSPDLFPTYWQGLEPKISNMDSSRHKICCHWLSIQFLWKLICANCTIL